jgi:hypothetical protein
MLHKYFPRVIEFVNKKASTGIAACILAVAASPLGGEISITVDLSGTPAEISPYIYGINDWTRNSTTKSTGYTINRLGGNRLTGYNWENNFSNAGSDWNNSSDNNLVSSLSSTLQAVPGEAVIQMVNHDRSLGIPSIVTLQLAGYVSADGDGTVDDADAAPSDRWKAVQIVKGSEFTTSPSTTDDYVYLDEEINYLTSLYGTSEDGGVFGYIMDNEPALWSSTHSLLHPDKPTVAEIISQNIACCKMVKSMDPSAITFGPASYGWSGYLTFQDATDWTSSLKSTYTWFLSYYLYKMQIASTTAGVRLLDVLDIHYYPEATGTNDSSTAVRITDSSDDSDGVSAARLQAPRSLWDTTYKETSWITSYSTYGPIKLIPRLQSSIDSYYPNTKIGITEYDFGGHQNYSGGLAQADVLGIYGLYGVYAATYWGTVEKYLIPAFQIYRNYDGAGSTFGDLSVPTTNPDAASYSTYASIDSTTGHLHLIAINKTSSDQSATIAISGSNHIVTSAAVYGFSSSTGSTLTEMTSVSNIASNSFTYTLPAYSVLHFVFSEPEIDGSIRIEAESSSTIVVYFKTEYGKTCKIQSSTDLKTWSDIDSTTYAGDGSVFKAEIAMPSTPTFWRVVTVE